MVRLFLPPEELTTQQISIHGEHARYLSSVLRVKPGELLAIFDGKGQRYLCRICKIQKKEVIAEKIKRETYTAESCISITLAQGIPKGEKMNFIVQKSTELGVRKIIPLITSRSQVRHTGKIERWRKIALSASQQSGREKIPSITESISFSDFLIQWQNDAKQTAGIIFSEEERNMHLNIILKDFKNYGMVTLLIGPEGGFSHAETKMAIEKGFIPASLGPRILRTETAALASITIVQHRLGDMV